MDIDHVLLLIVGIDLVPQELDVLSDAIRLEIWSGIWRENYAQTIVQFADRNQRISDILSNAIQPKPDFFDHLDDHIEQLSNTNSSVNQLNTSNHTTSSANNERCILL